MHNHRMAPTAAQFIGRVYAFPVFAAAVAFYASTVLARRLVAATHRSRH